MEFKYMLFPIEEYIDKRQPIFVLPDLEPTYLYFVLTDSGTGEISFTTSTSHGVRVPVHGFATPPIAETGFSASSLLTAIGAEVACTFLCRIQDQNCRVETVYLVISDNCHVLPDGRARAYFGLVAKASKR